MQIKDAGYLFLNGRLVTDWLHNIGFISDALKKVKQLIAKILHSNKMSWI